MLTGSALWNYAGDGIGNFGIIEAADADAARAFAQGDPFCKGGVVSHVELTRMADTFQAGRIQPLTQSG